jgi:hypothetical protein
MESASILKAPGCVRVMTVSPSKLDLAQLHERDIALWAEQTADLLRQGKLDQLDLVNLIDEVESLGRRERDRLLSSARLILHHLLEWHHQPEKRSRSWVKTIQRERVNIEAYLDDVPSLVRVMDQERLAKAYRTARKDAAIETDLPLDTFPPDCPYTWEQMLDADFPADLTREKQ